MESVSSLRRHNPGSNAPDNPFTTPFPPNPQVPNLTATQPPETQKSAQALRQQPPQTLYLKDLDAHDVGREAVTRARNEAHALAQRIGESVSPPSQPLETALARAVVNLTWFAQGKLRDIPRELFSLVHDAFWKDAPLALRATGTFRTKLELVLVAAHCRWALEELQPVRPRWLAAYASLTPNRIRQLNSLKAMHPLHLPIDKGWIKAKAALRWMFRREEHLRARAREAASKPELIDAEFDEVIDGSE